MGWEEEHKRKLASPEEAVEVVESGDQVYFPAPAQPRLLPDALGKRSDKLEGVVVHLCAPQGHLAFLDGGTEKAFLPEFELFIGDWYRNLMDTRRATWRCGTFSTQFKRFDQGVPGPIDVLMTVVSPPDKHGYCSFGGHLWNKRSMAKRARKIIVEQDANQIRTGGTNYIHVSEIDYFVEATPPPRSPTFYEDFVAFQPPEWKEKVLDVVRRVDPGILAILGADRLKRLPPEELIAGLKDRIEPKEEHRRMAGYLSELIHDRDTIQCGVGSPSRWMVAAGAFDSKHDLGIHTEMGFPDLTRLVRDGIVTGKYKSLHPEKVVASTFSGCTEADFAYMDDNPIFEQYDAEYVVNIRTISSMENFVGINNGIQIDLGGQINSESGVGSRLINGHGGQPETHIGGVLSPGGRAVTLLPATALDGAVSNIVPKFDEGAVVTIPRYFADYVITEFGIASLFGKTLRQRAQELISIAHPDFRAELRKETEKLF